MTLMLSAITNMPTSVAMLCSIGGIATMRLPADDAWRLIWATKLAGPTLVVVGERQALGVPEQVASKLEGHVLVDLGGNVLLEQPEDTLHGRQCHRAHGQQYEQRHLAHRAEEGDPKPPARGYLQGRCRT